MNLARFIVFISALFLAGTLPAQEKPSLEELLCWFPAGDYECIVHFDRGEFLKACPGELRSDFAQAAQRLFPAGSGQLPKSMVDKFDSSTEAVIGKAAFKNCYVINAKGEIERINRKCAMVVEANGRYYGAWMPTRRMRVFRFADLDSLVREALGSGEIEAIDQRIGKLQICSYRTEGARNDIYGIASPTGEWLTAENTEDLRDMIQAGMAGGSPVFGGTDLGALLEMSSDLDYFWKFYTPNTLDRMVLNFLVQKDARSPSIKPLSRKLETDVQCIIEDYHWDIDGNRVHRAVLFFGEDEKAGEEYLRIRQGRGSYYEPLHATYFYGRELSYRELVRSIDKARSISAVASSTTLDSNRIVIIRIDDKEALAGALNAYISFQTEWEKEHKK
jgi:hypothetical protein